MTIPITGQPPVPSLSEPDTFNTKALNLFTWQTGSMLDQFNNVDPNDFFDIPALTTAAAQSQTKNAIINGAFDIWQRGDVVFDNGFGPDRWGVTSTTGSVVYVKNDITGIKLGRNSPRFVLRHATSGQSGAALSLSSHRLEGVNTFAGETVTVLGWMRKTAGSNTVAMELSQYFGSGGGASATVNVAPVTISGLGGWAPFACVFNVPSISGKTLGPNNDDYLALNIFASAGTAYNARTNSLGVQAITYDTWGVHILQGTHGVEACDNYVAPRVVDELPRCQRYGYAFVPKDTPFGTYVGIAHGQNSRNTLTVPLPTVMRSAPSMEYGGEFRLFNDSGPTGNTTTLTLTEAEPNTVLISAVAGVFSNNAAMTVKVNNADCFIFLDAEL